MRRLFLLLAIILVCNAYGQTIASRASGNWNNTNTWNGGVIPTAANSTTIQVNHAITIPSGYSVTIDGTIISTGASVTVLSGGTFTIAAVANALVVNGSLLADNGSNLVVQGSAPLANVVFNANAIYNHRFTTTQGIIPRATWNATSTLQITGYTTHSTCTSAGGWGQNFGNVLFALPNLSADLIMDGNLTRTQGSLTINNTGGGTFTFVESSNTTVTIGTDLIISGPAAVYFQFTNSATSVATFNIGRDLTYTASEDLNGTTLGDCFINVARNFSMNATGRNFIFSSDAGGSTVLNTKGNLTITAGTINETGSGSQSRAALVFSGTTRQIVTAPTGFATNSIFDFTINTGATVELEANTALRGTNRSTLTVNGTLRLTSTNLRGALCSGNNNGGHVQFNGTNNRFYNSGAKLVYAGAAAQRVGNGHPATAGVDLVVENAAGVYVNSSSNASTLTIGGNLNLITGNFFLDGSSAQRTVIFGGNILTSGPNVSISGAQADVSFTGNGTVTLPLPTGTQTWRNLTVNRAASDVVIIPQPTVLTGSITATAGRIRFNSTATIPQISAASGIVDFRGQATVNGNVTLSTAASKILYNNVLLRIAGTVTGLGNLDGNENATLELINPAPPTTFGALLIPSSGDTLRVLRVSRGTVASPDNISHSRTLYIKERIILETGLLQTSTAFTMLPGSVIERRAGGSISGTISNPYDVIYTGTSGMQTGNETSGTVRNLTVGISSGTITLGSNLVLTGLLEITSGTLSSTNRTIQAGSITNQSTFSTNANISLAGNLIQNGTFTQTAGTTSFTGNTTISGSQVAQLHNIQVSGTLSAPALLRLTGNFTNSGTFNANTGTLEFRGTTQQSINGTSRFYSLTFNNNGGLINEGTTEISNLVTVGTNVLFDADGSLNNRSFTLLSTRDDNKDDASIAAIGTGGSVTGNVKVNRFMSSEGRIYRYLSAPVSNATIASLQAHFPVTGKFPESSVCTGCTKNASLFYYNAATSAYVAYPTTSNAAPLEIGRGYAAFIRQDALPGAVTMQYTGPVNQGTINLPLVHRDVVESWNLVGNPYPSAIDWNSANWTKTNISTTVAVRDNGTGMVRYYNSSLGGFGNLPNGTIATGQAFWVMTTAANPVLTVRETTKTVNGGSFYRQGTEAEVVTVSLVKDGLDDPAYLFVADSASNDLDTQDLPKIANDKHNLAFAIGNKMLAMNAVESIDCSTSFPLSMTFPKNANGTFVSSPAGTYELRIEKGGRFKGYLVFIHDAFTNTVSVLDHTIPYRFTITSSAASYATNRFSLTFEDQQTEPLQLNDSICAGNESMIYVDLPTSSNYFYSYDSLNQQTLVDNKIRVVGDSLKSNKIFLFKAGLCTQALFAGTIELAVGTTPDIQVQNGFVCNEGSVSLSASSTKATQFKWYESTDAETPIATTTGIFTTPVLQKSKSYFVASVTDGCQSALIEIKAAVHYPEPVEIVDAGNGVLVSSLPTGNLWFLNEVALESGNNQQVIARESGIYKVINQQSGCIAAAEYTFVVTAIEPGSTSVSVYPNPAVEEVRILSPVSGQVKLLDSNGKAVGTTALVAGNGTYEASMVVKNLPKGLYLVTIQTANGETTGKLIVE